MKEFKEDSEGFRRFLQEIAEQGDKKPFNCPLLAVLPEPVSYKNEIYLKGALICSSKIECEKRGIILTSPLCKIDTGPIAPNEKGELEASCDWNGSRVKLFIVSSSLKNKRVT